MARKSGQDKGVFQRKDRDGWWCQVFVNGRAKTYKCDSKSQAKALYGKLIAEIRERRFFPEQFNKKKDVTLRAWINRYLAGCTNRGIENERHSGRRWSLLLGNRLLRELTSEELRRVQSVMRARRLKIDALKQQGKKLKGRGWKDSTINRHFAFLSKVLSLAKKEGLIDRNPVSGIRRFPEVRTTRFFSEEELMRLKGVLAPADWAVVALAVETGLRREEQFSLTWAHVDLANAVLSIPMPKGGKTRHVPLSHAAIALLRANPSFLSSAWVYPGLRGAHKPMDPRAFMRRVFEPALRRAGIQGASWHKLRHTAASRRIMAGLDVVAVKDFLGHADIQTTMRYAHLAPNHIREGINKGSLGTLTGIPTGERPLAGAPMQAVDCAVD